MTTRKWDFLKRNPSGTTVLAGTAHSLPARHDSLPTLWPSPAWRSSPRVRNLRAGEETGDGAGDRSLDLNEIPAARRSSPARRIHHQHDEIPRRHDGPCHMAVLATSLRPLRRKRGRWWRRWSEPRLKRYLRVDFILSFCSFSFVSIFCLDGEEYEIGISRKFKGTKINYTERNCVFIVV